MTMDWATANDIRSFLDGGDPKRALAEIQKLGDAEGEASWYVAVMEAQCWDKLGNTSNAARVLEKRAGIGDPEPWIFYNLGSVYQKMGRISAAVKAFRQAHKKWGWEHSETNGYTFTHDYFAPNIPSWQRWFDTIITCPSPRCLEIGSWQGGSATWLLDNVVGPRGGTLTCVDTFEGSSEHAPWIADVGSIEAIFDRNISATGHRACVKKIKGFSQDTLFGLHPSKFDFIYIDGAHEAKYLLQDAVLCWNLADIGAHILFDDVDFTFSDYPDQNSVVAINAFKNIFSRDIDIIEDGRQLLIKKC